MTAYASFAEWSFDEGSFRGVPELNERERVDGEVFHSNPRHPAAQTPAKWSQMTALMNPGLSGWQERQKASSLHSRFHFPKDWNPICHRQSQNKNPSPSPPESPHHQTWCVKNDSCWQPSCKPPAHRPACRELAVEADARKRQSSPFA